MKQLLVLLTLMSLLLAACGGTPTPTTTMETYNIGEPVTFIIDDTIHLCEDELPYGIVQITESGEREVMLEHSCVGFAGSGVDQYCENGRIKIVEVVFCSDVMFCEDTRIDDTFTWDQQEYVEINEECAGETIRREIKQQVPEGKYEVTLRFLQNDWVVNRVLKEFMITSDELDPVELTGATVEEAVSRSLELWVTAPHRTELIEVLEDDGASARARVVAHFRTSADQDWTIMEATVECQKREDGWLCDQYSSFHSLPQLTILQFEYPGDRGIIDYAGHYLFKVKPIEGADGYRWVFIQNGVEVWDSFRNEQQLAGNEYGIHPGTEVHSKFVPGELEIRVRASIDGQWTHAGIAVIYLR